MMFRPNFFSVVYSKTTHHGHIVKHIAAVAHVNNNATRPKHPDSNTHDISGGHVCRRETHPPRREDEFDHPSCDRECSALGGGQRRATRPFCCRAGGDHGGDCHQHCLNRYHFGASAPAGMSRRLPVQEIYGEQQGMVLLPGIVQRAIGIL